jgi:hypothetical protein
MAFLPPGFVWPVPAEAIFAPDRDEQKLSDEEVRAALGERDSAVEEAFRRLRTSVGRSPGEVWIPFSTVSVTLTNQPSAEQFFNNDSMHVISYDAHGFTQARIAARVTTLSGSGNVPRLLAKYDVQAGGFSTVVADYADLGTGEVAASLAATGAITSEWIDLSPLAKDNIYLTVTMIGGDGAADPVVGHVAINLR